jgi:uncharacterized protein (DUF2141 family)
VKCRQFIFLCGIILISFAFTIANENTGSITIEVKGFKSDKGQARILLFKKGQEKYYPSEDEKAFKRDVVPIKNKKVVFTYDNIPFGDYAISVHHDEDKNDKVNTNFIGMPKESLGASNDAKGNFGPPSFEKAKFILKSSEIKLLINMVHP